jgi:hypothetical protein
MVPSLHATELTPQAIKLFDKWFKEHASRGDTLLGDSQGEPGAN